MRTATSADGRAGARAQPRLHSLGLDFGSDSADVLGFRSESADVLAFGSDTSL